MWRIWITILAGALGCTGKDPEPTLLDTLGPPDPTDGIETGFEGGYIDASFFAVIGRFAYDPELQRHVPFAKPGEGIGPMEVSVLIMDGSVAQNGVNEDNSCEVTLQVGSPQPDAPWVAGSEAWTGFDVPAGSPVDDRCRFYGLPGEFQGDAGSHVSKWGWGVGLSALTLLVEEELRNTMEASEWGALEPYILGGMGFSDIFIGSTAASEAGVTSHGYASAFEVDGNFQIAVSGTGNPIPVPSEGIDQEVGVARAYYEVQLGPFGPASLLTGEP
jgi:hypothetical protein